MANKAFAFVSMIWHCFNSTINFTSFCHRFLWIFLFLDFNHTGNRQRKLTFILDDTYYWQSDLLVDFCIWHATIVQPRYGGTMIKHLNYDWNTSNVEFAWHASGPEFDPYVWHILSWRFGHENISTAILPLLLIQEEQLSVTGERMCTKYW